jgi:hypothetical protein
MPFPVENALWESCLLNLAEEFNKIPLSWVLRCAFSEIMKLSLVPIGCKKHELMSRNFEVLCRGRFKHFGLCCVKLQQAGKFEDL